MFSDISRARFESIFIDVLYPTVKKTLTGRIAFPALDALRETINVIIHSMASFFDKYLTPISVGFPPVEVLATAGFALSIVDERKDSAGMTSDTSQILPSSNQTIYTSERSEESHPGQRF